MACEAVCCHLRQATSLRGIVLRAYQYVFDSVFSCRRSLFGQTSSSTSATLLTRRTCVYWLQRTRSWHRNDDGNPDFLISMGSPELSSDIPLLIYEVKREDTGVTEASQQMDRYVNWAMQYLSVLLPHASRKIWAVLVIGSKSDVYMMEQGSSIIKIAYGLETTGTQIQGILQRIRDQ